MVEARVPDDMRDWNAMDIFIFSNGQQYSPPRKYHLCSDDLKYWEATISFLAHSQYGSLHSKIDLYTIEGRKVDGPLELSNEAAYVAVTPPDMFIQSGYDKYLLKASRSWEKRQEKKLNATRNTPQEKLLHVSDNCETTVKINNKSPRDNSILTAENQKGNSKANSITKHKPSTYQKNSLVKRKLLSAKTIPRKVNNSGKSLDTSSQRERTILKRIVPANKSDIKDLSISTKVPPIMGTIFETESESTNKVITEQNHSPANNIDIKENVVTDNERSSFDVVMNTNYNVNRNMPPDNNNVYKHSENETTSVFVDTYKENKNKAVEDNEFNNNLINIMVNDHCINREFNLDKEVNQHPITTKEIGTQYSNVSINEKPQQMQTKECILNLNLNIDMKGYKPLPNNNNESLSECFSLKAEESFTNLKKDLDKEKLQTQDRFINSVNATKCVNNNVTSQTCDNTKFVIVRCSCSSHNSNNNKTFKLQCTNLPQDYFILVPTQEVIKSDSKSEWNSTVNRDVKTNNDKTCQSITNKISETVDNPELYRIPPKNTSFNNANTSHLENLMKNISLNSKTDIVKEHEAFKSPDDPVTIESVPKSSVNKEISTKSNLAIETKAIENIKVMRNKTQFSWTQTEWCDVLVEARCNQDGGYTFHLPSLEKLKQYKL